MLFDSHCHYYDGRFRDDLDELLASLPDKGIGGCVTCPSTIEQAYFSMELAEKYDYIYFGVGIHPHDAKDFEFDVIDEIREISKHPKCVCIGEVGLDYALMHSPKEDQMRWFEKSLELGATLDLPLVIHDRDAHQDVFDMVKGSGTRGIIHCFSGSGELGLEFIKQGYDLSFGGPITFTNNRAGVRAVGMIPLEHILIETDAPYLTPHPFRGKRNDSSFVRYVCEKVAEIKGITFDEAAAATTGNARRVFGID